MKKNVLDAVCRAKNKIVLGTTAGATLLSSGLNPVMAFGYEGPDGNKVMDGTVQLATSVGAWLGGGFLVFGVLTLILAIRNEDNEGRNKALIGIVCAVALLSVSLIFKMFGIGS